jgi:hypothetical protein
VERQSEEAKKGIEEHEKLTDAVKRGEIPNQLVGFIPEDATILVEEAFEESFYDVPFYARPDFVAIKDSTLYILDAKTGFADVTEMDPLQNIIAAALFIYTHKKGKSIKKIICRYIGTETRLSTFDVFTPSQIAEEIGKYVEKIKKGLKEKKPKLVTGSHCRRCKRRTACPKLQKAIKDFTNPKLRGVAVEELPVELIRLLPVADKIIKDFREQLKARLEDGMISDIGGVSLKYQNAPRSWDPSVDAESLASLTKKPVDLFLDSKLRTVASLLNEFPEFENKISNLIVQGKQARLVISSD